MYLYGDGTQPSTQLGLEWLEKQELKDSVVIDYGCGTGILGKKAKDLGASKVVCIDIFPSIATLPQGLEYHVNCPPILADFIVANMAWYACIELKPTILSLLKDVGTIAFPGIHKSRMAEMWINYPWFKLNSEKDDWVCLTNR